MKKLLSVTRSAITHYNMISGGDSIAVGVSGGKDSLALLLALAKLRNILDESFEVIALTIDPGFEGQPGNYEGVAALCKDLNISYHIRRTDLARVIFEERQEKNPCALCAKLRRGALHNMAVERGANKVALGHHRDDAVETLFLNMLNGGRIECFSPVSYLSRKNITLIRPLIFATEGEMVNLSSRLSLPVVKSLCPADKHTDREEMKKLLDSLEKTRPGLRKKLFGALQKAHISGF